MSTSKEPTRDPGQGEQLDFVAVVDVDGREDGIYLFARRDDAERFAAAVHHDLHGDEGSAGPRRAFVDGQALNVGEAEERLIAAERGDALEEVFGAALAEDVREGMAPDAALDRLREIGEGGSEAARLLRGWIELDRRTAIARS